jgi:membrane-bound lytic murein transglycosylase D
MTLFVRRACFIAFIFFAYSAAHAQETSIDAIKVNTETNKEAVEASSKDENAPSVDVIDTEIKQTEPTTASDTTDIEDLAKDRTTIENPSVLASENADESPSSTEDEAEMPAPLFGKQSGAVVFKRLRKTFSGPICKDTPAIENWKKRYAGNRTAFSNHLREILPLLDYVSSEVERRKLPGEYALIPIIESRYQPHAIGAGGPAGLWQMIGSTAKNHGVKIQDGYDGRFSVVDSTDAALSYLATLDGMFKDWQRSVMGYNAGEFRVLRAIKNSPAHTAGQDLWPRGLSPITYAYISKLQALSCVLAQPKSYGLTLPNEAQFTPLSAVLVDSDGLSLDKLAKRLNVDASKLKANNAAYKNGVIGTNMPRRLLLPTLAWQASPTTRASIDHQTTAEGNDPSDHGAEASSNKSSTTHRVKSGDTLWSISKHYGIRMQVLKQLNGLSAKTALRIGQQLKLSP